MLEWLVPICLFWILIAIYLGAWPVQFQGGSGLRQVIGLVNAFVLFLVVWALLRTALGGSGSILARLILPTTLTVLALPLITWIAFRILGIRVRLGAARR